MKQIKRTNRVLSIWIELFKNTFLLRFRVFFTIVFLLGIEFSNPCLAQFNLYHPFPDSNAWWSESYTNNVHQTKYYDYYVSGDTIVNSKNYFKLHTSGGYIYPGNVWLSYDSLFCLLREDSARKQIYASFKPYFGIKDTLLFDFGFNIADTLPRSYVNHDYPANYIKSIDSILIGTKYRKQFIVANNHSLGWKDSIIEGIGSTTGLVEGIAPPFESSSSLLCFKEKDTTVYPHLNDSCMNFILAMPTVKNEILQLNIEPNPNDGKFKVIFQKIMHQITIEILDVYGEKIFYADKLNIKEFNVDINQYPSGIYIYCVLNDCGQIIWHGNLVKIK